MFGNNVNTSWAALPAGDLSTSVDKKRQLPKDEGDISLSNPKRLKALTVEEPKQGKVTPNAEWLAGLSMEDAKAVYKVFRGAVAVKEKYQLGGADKAILSSLKAVSGVRDGPWYTEHVKCLIANISTPTGQHPRWQVRLNAGLSSLGQTLKQAISAKAWATLTGYTSYLKVEAHHVAYNADDRRVTAPLPLNVGAGGSLSHLCDECGCVKPPHLEATPVHKDNMNRQRCLGIVLLYFQDTIVKEIPCKHGIERGSDLESGILASCTKVRLIEIDAADFVVMQSLYINPLLVP
jgi:hypothetical protein